MPLTPPLEAFPGGALVFRWDRLADGALQAAGRTPLIQEEDDGVALPPAGASRADALFSTVGMLLIAALILSALLLLFRRGR